MIIRLWLFEQFAEHPFLVNRSISISLTKLEELLWRSVAILILQHNRLRLGLQKPLLVLAPLLAPFRKVNLVLLSSLRVLCQWHNIVCIELDVLQIIFVHFKGAILALVLFVAIRVPFRLDQVLEALCNLYVLHLLPEFTSSFDHVDDPRIVLCRENM